MISPIGKKTARSKGFTLIELVLVIILISVITALSAPLFSRTFSDLVIRNTALDMAKMINYAQEMAIIEKSNYKLNIDSEKAKYWITRYKPAEEGFLYERIKGRYGKMFFLPRGLALTCDKSGALFYPDGRSDKVEIKVRDKSSGETRIVKIKGFASRVQIRKQ